MDIIYNIRIDSNKNGNMGNIENISTPKMSGLNVNAVPFVAATSMKQANH